MESLAALPSQLQHGLTAPFLLRIEHLMRHLSGGGAGPGRVLEDVDASELHFLHKARVQGELICRLAREANDNISGDTQIRDESARRGHQISILGCKTLRIATSYIRRCKACVLHPGRIFKQYGEGNQAKIDA